MLSIAGFALFVSGPFVMDPAGTPLREQSWHGLAHNVFGAMFFSLSTLSCFVFWKRFRALSSWQSLQWPALFTGVVMTVAVLLLKAATYPGASNPLTDVTGLLQRTALIPFMLWVSSIAWSLREQ